MSKKPRLCCSHTVKGTCSVQVTGVGAFTIAEGTYWTDKVYDGANVTPNLFWAFLNALDSLAGSGTTLTWSNQVMNYSSLAECDLPATTLEFGHASTTEEARRMAKRLGFNPIATTPDLNPSAALGVIEGYWESTHAEMSKLQEDQDKGNAASSESWSGYNFGFRLGSNMKCYLLRLDSIPELYTWSRGQVQSGADIETYPYDLSFEARIYQYLQRGEMVRFYADAAAAHTYLSNAMTKTSATAVVNSAASIAADEKICVDGEWMYVISKVGTTLTVYRDNPETHPASAPVSKDFVATYVLDTEGGNINVQEFAPKRRAHNVARYDLEIALRRAKWAG